MDEYFWGTDTNDLEWEIDIGWGGKNGSLTPSGLKIENGNMYLTAHQPYDNIIITKGALRRPLTQDDHSMPTPKSSNEPIRPQMSKDEMR